MEIEHDPDRGRFFIRLGDEEAFLSYRREGDLLDFGHVFVPPAHRGKSHAGKILIAGFEFARSEGCKVIPTCPYIAHEFLPRFPQYQDLVK
jgi:uncharacterized protein